MSSLLSTCNTIGGGGWKNAQQQNLEFGWQYSCSTFDIVLTYSSVNVAYEKTLSSVRGKGVANHREKNNRTGTKGSREMEIKKWNKVVEQIMTMADFHIGEGQAAGKPREEGWAPGRTQISSTVGRTFSRTVLIKRQLVELQAARLFSYKAMHALGARFMHGDGILQRLHAWLEAERHLGVSHRMPGQTDRQTDRQGHFSEW